ncbi:MAG: carboxypeptidase-like regulatory domain-containing protein [Acidobacteriota bacterium]
MSSSNEAPSTAESATPTGTVSGRVVGPDGNALPGAAVRVDGTTVTTRTDVSGVFVELINLNDEPFRVYEGSPDRPVQEEIYSWWGTIGLQWDL